MEETQEAPLNATSTGRLSEQETLQVAQEKEYDVTLEEAWVKAGGWGRFQTFLLVSLILAMNSGGLLVYGITYLELYPAYVCTRHDGTLDYECTQDPQEPNNFCKGDLYQSWEVDWSNPASLDNWIVQLDLFCTDSKYIGLMGAAAFGGAFLACLFLPAASDKYGRWVVFQLTMLCQLPLFVAALATRNLVVIYILCFYVGVCLIGRFTCGFVLLTECTPAKYHVAAQTSLMVGDAAATLYLTIYYRFISIHSYPIFWVSFSLNLLTAVVAFFYKESPQWLMSQNRYDEARASFSYIAKFNGVSDFKLVSFSQETEKRAAFKQQTSEVVAAEETEITEESPAE